jgi:dephospho-CoA kinase
MRIIGITGTMGAGKGTVVDYLVGRHGFVHFSARAFIVEEIERRGLPVSRDSMVDVANDLRKAHGANYIIQTLYTQAKLSKRDAVIESVRNPSELSALRHDSRFFLIALDADPNVRYERIVQRGSVTDHISYEKFIADEMREMHSDDPTHQNISAVMEKADYLFKGTETPEEVYRLTDEALKDMDRKLTQDHTL